MVPQNGPQQRTQQQAGFSNFMSPGLAGGVDPLSFNDDPHVAKQMAALNAMNQARMSQSSRPAPSPLSASGGTSSGSYLGSITNSHNFPSNGHDLLNVSASPNGHANFSMSNNFGLPQNPSSASNGSFLDPTSMSQGTMSRPQVMKDHNQQLKARETGLLQGLANYWAKNGTPLPPALSGMSFPNYDASTSPWSFIDPGSEIGHFKIASRDIAIFKLWATVIQAGGSAQIESNKMWPSILTALGLPAEATDPQTNNQVLVLKELHDVYMRLLAPFETIYRRNIQEQQKKLQMSQQPVNGNPQAGMRSMSSHGLMPGTMGLTNGSGTFPSVNSQQRPSLASSDSHGSLGASDMDPFTQSEPNLLDQDVQGIKRKHNSEGPDMKRVRQKTDPPEGNPLLADIANNAQSRPGSQPPAAAGTPNRPRQQPARRKIEYVPLGREVETFGGWDVNTLDAEWHNQQSRRPIRDISEWGLVDTEHLCMSLRSRLAVELSYALTTFTVLSTMREQQPGTGLSLSNCPDLLDDVLDLLEETAFGGPEQEATTLLTRAHDIPTNRELLTLVQDQETRPFASLDTHQGSKDPSLGPFPRPASIIIAIVAIIRNLSVWTNNWDFLAASPRVTDMLLRLCMVERDKDNNPCPVAECLSIADLIFLRREIMVIFVSISGSMKFTNTPSSRRIAKRLFELTASYLVDSTDAVPPLASVQLAGVVPTAGLRPPLLAETALDVLTRFTQPDYNRQLLTKIIPQSWIHQLIANLVHRVPMVESDFLLMQRDYWAGYVEKIIMGIYSLFFIAPYDLKQRIKADRRLGVKNVLLRMAQRVLTVPNDGRAMFAIPARRSIEALKLLDRAEEKVDTVEPELPALQFGMGFSDGSDSSFEKGTGLLGANRDVAWEMLMMRDVLSDEVFFNELDSLVRVESS
ncbi:hypothetical protein CPB83DRAFT_848300 [Crepidotus variabilis]|uniref:ARID domain-containing protein n=1 Tax=Crepidotus variabilis TaxID=179855 RepID=A0A9P6ENE9_9AGAR|nr:hypothetical protein CPB83DRAFT_848300 [Crepidotus variabilis]